MHWVHLLSGRPPVRIWPGVPYKTPQDGEFPHPAVFFAVWGAFLKKMTKICEKSLVLFRLRCYDMRIHVYAEPPMGGYRFI